MPQSRNEGLITAIDIGSSKISALIARADEAGELEVLGTGQRESRGVRRGYIADMEATEAAIREAVEQAETIARTNIDHVWVSFFGRRPCQRRRPGRGRPRRRADRTA